MCGIGVFLSRDLNSKRYETLRNCLEKRGKDEFNSATFGEYTVLHSRLHMFGRFSDGKQPYKTSELLITFNGELYDTSGEGELEKLERLYQTYGDDLSKYIEGQYAITIIDKRQDKILLLRDRYGQKPLFFDQKNQWIGSTIESHKIVYDSKINEKALREYLLFGHRINEPSFSIGVREVPHGCTVIMDIQMSKCSILRNPVKIKSDEGLAESLRSEVKKRVAGLTYNFTTLLSGGIDSYLVSHYCKEYDSKKFELAYTTKVEGPRDESKRAQRSAVELGLKLQTTESTLKKAREFLFNELYMIYDEPIADPSALLVCIQLRDISDKYKVILTGDGADEIFRGYNRYKTKNLLLLWYAFSLNWVFRFLGKFCSVKPELRQKNLSEAFLLWTSKLKTESIKDLTDLQLNLRQISQWDLNYYLPNNINPKLDRACLFFGKEIRSPFLGTQIYKYTKTRRIWDFRYKKTPLRKLAKQLGYQSSYKTGYSFGWKELCQSVDYSDMARELSGAFPSVRKILEGVEVNDVLVWRVINLYLWLQKR